MIKFMHGYTQSRGSPNSLIIIYNTIEISYHHPRSQTIIETLKIIPKFFPIIETTLRIYKINFNFLVLLSEPPSEHLIEMTYNIKAIIILPHDSKFTTTSLIIAKFRKRKNKGVPLNIYSFMKRFKDTHYVGSKLLH